MRLQIHNYIYVFSFLLMQCAVVRLTLCTERHCSTTNNSEVVLYALSYLDWAMIKFMSNNPYT